MANDLIVFEQQLTPLAPHFAEALAGVMPVERLMRTALIAAEKNPYLLECDRQSFFNTIMSAGVLGLEMDGVTGQCFPIPFKRRIQLVIGYKGYNTLGARAGLTITGEVVRESDDFDYSLGTSPFLNHKPKPGNKGRIVHAWAVAAANDRPPVISVLGIDELMEIKDKSPGAKRDDSPWNNPAIGFPAMCSKSAKRRLCRSTPLNVMQLAARMEEAFEEQGKSSFIKPSGELVIEGDASPIAASVSSETPSAETLMAPREKPDPLAALKADGHIAAKEGMTSLQIWFKDLPRDLQAKVKPYLDNTLKAEADRFDAQAFAASGTAA